ncbi:DUF7662 domain-containing protein [Enterococcus sp. HY326]|uniref:DUF7662 domain-containing protein n=1 Tax=Enterococcus sp. HY326 TaxID=2971265 RepID=UPI002240400A|nr:hypothetical protein [Enterococcus sp. HY326]
MKQRTRKYDGLTHYLKSNNGSQVTLTFTQFDELLFPYSGLPQTAQKDKDWWANDYLHPEKGAYGWLNAGYEVVVVNLAKEFIVFNKLVKSSSLLG